MAAPLPMRFYNPIKDLCERTKLDYQTVIENCIVSADIRNALINAEIPKPIQEYTEEEKEHVKRQMVSEKVDSGKVDKGRERYDMGITVEYLIPDLTSEKVEPPTETDSRYTKDAVKYLAPPAGYRKWIPGKSNE
jgi:hypothetical protein